MLHVQHSQMGTPLHAWQHSKRMRHDYGCAKRFAFARHDVAGLLENQWVEPQGSVPDASFVSSERPQHRVRQAKVDGKHVLLVAGENHHQG